MNVSISGMRYRINRIEELIQVDLSKASSKFEIQISLQTYMAFNPLKKIKFSLIVNKISEYCDL
jgi:PucR family transcriptional regulator, purine catabolism regulatory protein